MRKMGADWQNQCKPRGLPVAMVTTCCTLLCHGNPRHKLYVSSERIYRVSTMRSAISRLVLRISRWQTRCEKPEGFLQGH
ncbi:hypothetical protein IF2G_07938 [Cordyceps javanica]|nr:hypothetical protein IF2G_07938 [Cordyceps javanica]